MNYTDKQSTGEIDEFKYQIPHLQNPRLNSLQLNRHCSLERNALEFRLASMANRRSSQQTQNGGVYGSLYSMQNGNEQKTNSVASSDEPNRLSRLVSLQNSGRQNIEQNAIKFSDDFLENQSNMLKRLQLKVRMKQIIKFLPIRMLQSLNQNHFKWIGDASSFFLREDRLREGQYTIKSFNASLFQQSGQLKRLVKSIRFTDFLCKILSSIPIFHPANKFRQIWCIIQLIIINLILILLPIQLVFSLSIQDILSHIGANVIFFFMIADNIIQMNTGYYQRGVAILERKEIIKKYFKEHLLDSLFADLSIILHFLFFNRNNSWILLLYFFKIKAIKGLQKQIFQFIQISPLNMNFILLLKLTINILLVSHYFACIWVQVAYWEESWMSNWNSIQKTWMDSVAIIKEGGWVSQYIAAYYFSSVTMITVGYGDIKAENEVEMVLCTLNMIIACGVFAFSINQIGFIFEQFGKEEKQIQGNMYIINRYMNEHKISSRFQYQVRQYLEYYWSQTKENYEKQEKEIIGQLTENLRFEMKQEANRLVLKDSSIFSNNFSQSFINRLVPYIKESTVIPDQYVIKQNGDEDDGSIYFVKKGSLKVVFETIQNIHKQQPKTSSISGLQSSIVFYNKDNLHTQNSISQQQAFNNKLMEFKILGEGEYFGQIRFFTGNARNASVITTDFTKLLYIRREDFLNVIKQFPQDYEVLAQINHVFKMSGVLQNCGIKCFSCNSLSHTIQNCPFLQFTCDKYNLMKRNKLLEVEQSRESCFVRQKQFKNNPFSFIPFNQISRFEFLDSMSSNCDEEEPSNNYEGQEEKKLDNYLKTIQEKDNITCNQIENSDNIVKTNQIISNIAISQQQIQLSPHRQNPLSPKVKNRSQNQIGTKSQKQSPKARVTSIERISSLSGNEEIQRSNSNQQQDQNPSKTVDEIIKPNNEDQIVQMFIKRIESCLESKLKGISSLIQNNFNQSQIHHIETNQGQDSKDGQENYSKSNIEIRNQMKHSRNVQQKGKKGTIVSNQSQSLNKQQSYFSNSNSSNHVNGANYQQNCFNCPSNFQQYQQFNTNQQVYFPFLSSQQIIDDPNHQKNLKANNHSKQNQPLNVMKSLVDLNQMMYLQQKNMMLAQIQEKYEGIDKNFDNFRIYKKFLVHNNINVILKKINDQSNINLQQYQQLIQLKLLMKKTRRRELKIYKQNKSININSSYSNLSSGRNYQIQTPHQIKEKSQYGCKSQVNETQSIRRSAKGDKEKQDQTGTALDVSSYRVGDDQSQFFPSISYRNIPPVNKQIQVQFFQNKCINSISNVMYSGRQNRANSSVYEQYFQDQSDRQDNDLFKNSKVDNIDSSFEYSYES